MLNCELCDYFKTLNVYNEDGTEKTVLKCEYAGFTFPKSPDVLDIEYPCNTIDYLQNTEEVKTIEEYNDECFDWKYLYSKYHIKPSDKNGTSTGKAV